MLLMSSPRCVFRSALFLRRRKPPCRPFSVSVRHNERENSNCFRSFKVSQSLTSLDGNTDRCKSKYVDVMIFSSAQRAASIQPNISTVKTAGCWVNYSTSSYPSGDLLEGSMWARIFLMLRKTNSHCEHENTEETEWSYLIQVLEEGHVSGVQTEGNPSTPAGISFNSICVIF